MFIQNEEARNAVNIFVTRGIKTKEKTISEILFLDSLSPFNWELLLLCKFLQRSGELSNKNINVTTIMFLMSGDLTGLCLYMTTLHCYLNSQNIPGKLSYVQQ